MKIRNILAVAVFGFALAAFGFGTDARADHTHHHGMHHDMHMAPKAEKPTADAGQKMPCCKDMRKCPMKNGAQKRMHTQAFDRTAGSVVVYGQAGCSGKTGEGMGKNCPMMKGDMPKNCGKDPKKCPLKKEKCPMEHGKTGMSMPMGAPHEGMKMNHGGHHMAGKGFGGAEAAALDEAMAKMHSGMAVPYTGDADADFIRGMIPHHQGAIDMAQIVLKYGDDEQAKALARNIIKAQKGEIAFMKRWLKERQLPETAPVDLRK